MLWLTSSTTTTWATGRVSWISGSSSANTSSAAAASSTATRFLRHAAGSTFTLPPSRCVLSPEGELSAFGAAGRRSCCPLRAARCPPEGELSAFGAAGRRSWQTKRDVAHGCRGAFTASWCGAGRLVVLVRQQAQRAFEIKAGIPVARLCAQYVAVGLFREFGGRDQGA